MARAGRYGFFLGSRAIAQATPQAGQTCVRRTSAPLHRRSPARTIWPFIGAVVGRASGNRARLQVTDAMPKLRAHVGSEDADSFLTSTTRQGACTAMAVRFQVEAMRADIIGISKTWA